MKWVSSSYPALSGTFDSGDYPKDKQDQDDKYFRTGDAFYKGD